MHRRLKTTWSRLKLFTTFPYTIHLPQKDLVKPICISGMQIPNWREEEARSQSRISFAIDA